MYLEWEAKLYRLSRRCDKHPHGVVYLNVCDKGDRDTMGILCCHICNESVGVSRLEAELILLADREAKMVWSADYQNNVTKIHGYPDPEFAIPRPRKWRPS